MALPIDCPICKSNYNMIDVVTPHVYGDKEKKRAFFKCNNCLIIFQHPMLNPSEEKKFYYEEFEKFMNSRSGEEGGWQKSSDHILANQDTVKRRSKYLDNFIKEEVSEVLEIGCSSGFMLYPLKKIGKKCIGIEPSGVFSEFVNSQGIKVYESIEELKQNEPQKRFDLILHFFVLEHIVDPITFFTNQLELLSDKGKIIFEVPNYSDPLSSIYDIPKFERFYWSIAHPYYYNQESLEFILKKFNKKYTILFDQRYDLSNHINWALEGKPGGMGKFTKSLGIELEQLYRQQLIKNKICDTLIGVIDK